MISKSAQLRKHKFIATALLVLMALVYCGTFWAPASWSAMPYVRAFSEAAMVGALADWFAVTALFRRPLGLPIPHTNLIEKSKNKIGANLGEFVTTNFLTPATIRPRLEQLSVAAPLATWLLVPKNRRLVTDEALKIARAAVAQMDRESMTEIITRQAKQLLVHVPLHLLAGDALAALVRNGKHQDWMRLLAESLRDFIVTHSDVVKEKVKEESHFLIPGFVDNMIAARITKGVTAYLDDFASDQQHAQRLQITQKLLQLAERWRTDSQWKDDFTGLKTTLLADRRLAEFSAMAWDYLQEKMRTDLADPDAAVGRYLDKTLAEMAETLATDREQQRRIDRFVQLQAFKLIHRHKDEVAELIRSTVGRWNGRTLSDKLELEVGKDLQFIRLNGTLVGGLVGLVIYVLTHLFLKR